MSRIYNEKTKRMKRFISKRYTKLWQKMSPEMNNNYVSKFGAMVSFFNNGVLIYYDQQTDPSIILAEIRQKRTKIAMIESLVTQFSKKQITCQQLLDTISSQLN